MNIYRSTFIATAVFFLFVLNVSVFADDITLTTISPGGGGNWSYSTDTGHENDIYAVNSIGTLGRVGIGTVAPGARLEVVGTTTVSPLSAKIDAVEVFRVTSEGISVNDNYGIEFAETGDSGNPPIRHASANTGIFFPSNTSLGFVVNGSQAMSILGAGNVGIGTTSPGTNKLEVAGGPIKATGGLILQTVASQAAEDAMTKVPGQIWFRTDV